MPTTRKRTSRAQKGSGGITEVDYLYFSSGPFFDAEDYEKGKTENELKAFWKKHRALILDRYLKEMRLKGWKGSRPWPVWEFDLTEQRLRTEPKEFDSQRVWDRQRGVFDWVETDFEYLERLGLLEPWEIEAIQKGGGS